MMDAVGEPHALEIFLKSLPIGILLPSFQAGVGFIQCLTGSAYTEVISAVLVKEDVASPEGSLGEAIDELLLLQAQRIELRHVVADDLQVIEFIHVVNKFLLLLLATHKKGQCNDVQCTKDSFFHQILSNTVFTNSLMRGL